MGNTNQTGKPQDLSEPKKEAGEKEKSRQDQSEANKAKDQSQNKTK